MDRSEAPLGPFLVTVILPLSGLLIDIHNNIDGGRVSRQCSIDIYSNINGGRMSHRCSIDIHSDGLA